MAAFWSDARNVSIHDGHAENQALQELLHLVEQPLPKWVKKGPYPTTCIHLSYLVCELTNRKSSRHQTRSNRNDELASLFILALESTDTIRRCWSDGRKEYIGAHVIILITSIFRQLNPDCIALENAFVPLPKHPVCGYNPLMDYTPRFSVVPLMFFLFVRSQ
ncbi:uncharacterized protein BT62DRAFT_1013708 [Guyanagaster necrorhizus]|uniref:Uncharacterized protein n=1 Tax=Guyanagaster necrorhizus TaxID=856835 RepID=A0A9P7VG85_9AGAR|nr:uncharacterized protein BT62DRAFT_1013708 [Guyanagaster necrorhizus MCA 3950]KAG7439571.1 hypothetical protein BT62DRAFT_1013708 [Guyanagaster necrorhizus MCA 3950]